MSRIDFGLIAAENDVSIMMEKGRKIKERAKQHDSLLGGDGKNGYYASKREGHYAVSERAQRDTRGMYHAPGNSEYRNPALDLALSFAIKNNDKKLIKALERINKYSKAAYEANYSASDLTLRVYEKAQRAAETLDRKKETLAFIKRYSKYTNSELIKLKKEKKEQLSSNVSYEVKKALTSEIELIDELIKMSDRKRKKWIMAKGKEIREIVESAEKNKSDKNRYIKYMRSAHKNSQKLYGEEFEIAWEMIGKMKSAITPVFYGQNESGEKKTLNAPEFEINKSILERIEKELTEEYYSNSNAKKR